MAKYRKIPAAIEATQWFKNGDHPLDYANEVQVVGGAMKTFSPEYQRENGWSGQVVGRYRGQWVAGQSKCGHCLKPMDDHGLVGVMGARHIVCPGDWIITGASGEYYPCDDETFKAKYEKAD